MNSKIAAAVLTVLCVAGCTGHGQVCGDGNGEGCGLLAAMGVVVLAAPVVVPAKMVSDALARGPQPRIDDGADRIALERVFEPGNTADFIAYDAQNHLVAVSDHDRRTTFWTADGETSDFLGHEQAGTILAQSDREVYFLDSSDLKTPESQVHAVDVATGVSRNLLVPCQFVDVRLFGGQEVVCNRERQNVVVNLGSLQTELSASPGEAGLLFLSAVGGGHMFVAGRSGRLRWYDGLERNSLGEAQFDGNQLWSVAAIPRTSLAVVVMSPYEDKSVNQNGNQTVVRSYRGSAGKAVVYDLETHQSKVEIPLATTWETQAVPSGDGRYFLLSLANEHAVEVYDVATLKRIGVLTTGEKYSFQSVAFDQEGKLFTGLIGNKVYVFRVGNQ